MFSWSARFDPASCARRVEFRGKEHLENALRQGRGAILWESNALGCRLLAKKTLYAHGFAVHQVHGPDNLGGLNTDNKNATWVRRVWLKPFFDEREEQFTAGLIDLPHANSLAFTRRMVECLERNEILCVAGDGAFGHKKIKLCFLGHPTPFATGLVSLARLTRTPVLPMFCLRARNDGAVLEIRAPLTIPDGAERTALTRELVEQYATQLEARVRQAPGQYRNWHLLGTDQVKRP
jgi:lauroyl/myristoyl acyltransferase